MAVFANAFSFSTVRETHVKGTKGTQSPWNRRIGMSLSAMLIGPRGNEADVEVHTERGDAAFLLCGERSAQRKNWHLPEKILPTQLLAGTLVFTS